MNNQLIKQLARKRSRKGQQGFSLVELLVVVVILGILSGVAIPNFLKQRDKAKVGAANASAASLISACEVAVTSDIAPNADADVIKLQAKLPAIATATVNATTCTVAIPAVGIVKTAGAFAAFDTPTLAVAN